MAAPLFSGAVLHCHLQSGFEIDEIGYLDRKEYFPKDALFDGKESIWFIATKKN